MNIIGYKILNSSNLESTGRVESNWRNNCKSYYVSFVSSGKLFPTLKSVKKHLENVLIKKVSMSDWKLVEVYVCDGPSFDSLIDERMMMKVLKS